MPVPRLSPQMIEQLQSITGGAGSGISRGMGRLSGLAAGDEDAFKAAEAPAYTAFQKNLGQIGSRFGGFGALGSSAFQNATSGAAASLAENLASNRLGIQNDAMDRLLQLYSMALGNQTAQEDDDGFDWGGLLGMLGAAGGASFLGPLGAGLGGGFARRILG